MISRGNLRTLRSILRYPKSFRKFKKFGKNIWLSRGGTIGRPEEISFGDNVFINEGFHISARNLSFGSNIMIGPGLLIECDNHVFNIPGKTMFDTRKERHIGTVEIRDDVWIGGRTIILKDVVIDEGSVIGANSLVNKSTLPYTINFGIPSKPYKTRFRPDELKIHLETVQSRYSYEEIIALWQKANLV